MINFRRYVIAFRRWFFLILLGPILAGGAAYLASRQLSPVYASTVRIIVGQSLQTVNPDYGTLAASERLVSTYAQLAQSRSVIEAVTTKLARPDVSATARVSTRAVPDTEFLDITVQANDAGFAADMANNIANELILRSPTGPQSPESKIVEEVTQQIEVLSAEIAATDREITDLKKQIDQVGPDSTAAKPLLAKLELNQQLQSQNRQTLSSLYNTVLGNRSNSISIVEPALVTPTPIAPRPLRSGIIAAILALMLILGIVALLEFLDDTIKSPEEAAELAQVPLLATIIKQPKVTTYPDRLITRNDSRSLVTESFRTLRTNLQFSTVDVENRTLVITSAQPEEGKSTTIANLAWVLAQAGQRVVLVDADLRKPTIHRIFGLDNIFGLTTILTNTEDTNHEGMIKIDDHLTVIPSGPMPPNPSELLSSKRMEMLIWVLQQDFDWVLFDTPPLLTVTDSAVLLPRVEGAVLVTESKRTRRDMIKKSRLAIETVGGKLLGITVNKLDPRNEAYGSYYYNYHYQQPAEKKRRIFGGTKPTEPAPTVHAVTKLNGHTPEEPIAEDFSTVAVALTPEHGEN